VRSRLRGLLSAAGLYPGHRTLHVKTRKFIDQVVVHVRAGKGGDGSGSFRREACVPLGGPDGGDGGRGGHVIFRGSHDEDSLIALYFAPQLFAEDGISGGDRKMHGRNGDDLTVLVPCGTQIFDAESGHPLVDIVADGQEELIARGGVGGLGNVHFKSATHQAPTEHTPGTDGQEFRLRLELKTIADAGLIGFPNAGKSSLLQCVSAARPRVADYPFTTLNPVVGTVEYDDFAQIRVADVPGIIEGAASGVGLGLRFLKHITRSSVLVYVIDMAGVDNREPWQDYATLRGEIGQYDESLLERPFLVLANKMDMESAPENFDRFVRETGVTPLPVSALDASDEGVAHFRQTLRDIIKPQPRGSWGATTPADERSAQNGAAPPDDTPAAVNGFISADALARAPFLDLDPVKPPKRRRRTRRRG
jgi:GTPase